MENKIKVGDIKPIYKVVEFQVCKKSGSLQEQEWIPTESYCDAEILSWIYQNKSESEPEEEVTKSKQKKKKPKTLEEEKEELQRRVKELEGEEEEDEEEINDIDDEDL